MPAPSILDHGLPVRVLTPSVSRPKRTLDLPPHIIPLQGFAFVVQLLPTRQADRDFGAPPLKVDVERDDRKPTFRGLGCKPAELTTVNEELTRTQGVWDVDVGLLIRTDVEVVQPQLSTFHTRKRVREVGTPVPEGLHLGPCQYEARFELFENFELVAGLPIPDGRRFSPGLLCHQFS